MDDVSLLDRARRGSEQAFSQLFALHQRAIYRYAVYMCGPDGGDDIVQETFLAVLRQTGRSDALRGTVISYLFGIARHVVMKRLSARGVVFVAEQESDALGDMGASEQPTALDDLTRAETIAAIRTAVESLPVGYRA